MLKATDGIDENFLDTVSPLIGLEYVLRMAEVFFPKEGVFRIGPSFPLDFVAYSVFIPVSDLVLLSDLFLTPCRAPPSSPSFSPTKRAFFKYPVSRRTCRHSKSERD